MKSSSASGRILSLVALSAVLLGSPFLGGCVVVAAGAAGAGAVAWVRGELSASLGHDIDDTFAAAQRALKDLKIVKIEEQKTGIDGKLLYRTALDKKVDIRLERIGDKLTKVRIRVDLLGDQDLSQTILNKINDELR